ncbi:MULTISPECIES: acetoin reductase [Mycobacteriaceae]|uniref:diacetyl reductase [(S)-acetoin forming] n=1 Tax=Mycolicibacterium neoaurum TaxID=1795 RepID=A0A7T1NVQ1_MYCNE|nr:MULTISPECIES: acetoin reductase [Mycobacteriaceae]AMO04008.1 diacetyl reductase [Mycolicibacterium neoaurum]AXK77730.1 acetoin reductase [Mycolicibacterium neoaurum]KUM07581.1 diacetyl reductase [Mycolicibacterium neoaurum]MDO3403348.1 acetoin reductase [Mycolicibacterium neoaurum]QPO14756.1 putative alcohol dehydrogenase padh11 [Mycolicibacterium neoaurum]
MTQTDTTRTIPAPLLGEVALVTGAGRGIGRGIAHELAGQGADIALVDIHPDALAQVAEEIAEIGSKVTTFVADISDRDAVFAAVEHAAAALGGFDIMVNNAGIALVGPIAEVTPEQLSRLWAINVDGVLWGIQAAVAKFIALGNKERGKISRIINASSIAGHEGFAMLGPYSATKFAVRALTQAAAKEHAADGITVNAYCPGVVGTDMWVEIDKRFAELTGAKEGETFEKFSATIALGRPETPEDVAGFVAYLAGPGAAYMTGQAGLIDGGMVYR